MNITFRDGDDPTKREFVFPRQLTEAEAQRVMDLRIDQVYLEWKEPGKVLIVRKRDISEDMVHQHLVNGLMVILDQDHIILNEEPESDTKLAAASS